jgi:protease-4
MTNDLNPPSPHTSPPPPPPPPQAAGLAGPSPHPGTPAGLPQPQHHLVRVVAKPSVFSSMVSMLIGVFALACVLIAGVMIGIAFMFAGSSIENVILEQPFREGGRSKVVILPVHGVIDARQAAFVRTAADHILQDSAVSAVVLRVDSPGGGVTASDQIWYQVGRIRSAGLPIVASYGGVAASGGYYASCSADHIMAEPTCITGSIGVIAQVMTMEGLMDKVGIEPVTLVASSSPRKSIANDVFRTWTEEDRAKVLSMLDSAYAMFRQRVQAGRARAISDAARLDQIADGSIYTAEEARGNGLIDAIGYLDDAIAKAESLGGVRGSATVVMLAEPPSLFDAFGARERAPAADLLDPDRIRTLVNDLASPRLLYLMR